MLVAQNNQNHYTGSFKAPAGQPMPLVVRRGEPFKMRITFSRLIGPDDFQIEFRIGESRLSTRLWRPAWCRLGSSGWVCFYVELGVISVAVERYSMPADDTTKGERVLREEGGAKD